MSRVKREDVIKQAELLGIHAAVYAPGDGTVRYRIFPGPADYFSGPGLGFILGAKQAMIWLDGYEAGRKQADAETLDVLRSISKLNEGQGQKNMCEIAGQARVILSKRGTE